jgi:hypothetical protein
MPEIKTGDVVRVKPKEGEREDLMQQYRVVDIGQDAGMKFACVAMHPENNNRTGVIGSWHLNDLVLVDPPKKK